MIDAAIRHLSAAERDATTGLAAAIAAAVARSGRLPTGLTLPVPTIADETADAWVARRHADQSHVKNGPALVIHTLDGVEALPESSEGLPYVLYPVALSYLTRDNDVHTALAQARHTLALAVRVALAAWPAPEVSVGEYRVRGPLRPEIRELEPRAPWGDAIVLASRVLPIAVLDAYGFQLA